MNHRVLVIAVGSAWALGHSGYASEDVTFFERDIRPLLEAQCLDCHAVGDQRKIKGGLRLDHQAGWQIGGESGAALVPGKPEESLLIRAIRYRDPDLQMPPKKKLSKHQIALLEKWVALDAPDPRTGIPSGAGLTNDEAELDLEVERQFWSFQAPQKVTLPLHPSAESAIDALALAKLKDRGLKRTGPASPLKLIRRAAFGLTGLPPASQDFARKGPDAYERQLDRWLASPRYGERWGRHWLDVARYSDSNGMDENMAHTSAYRFRDYVIDAFNRDLPFDQFAIEQLAGDLLGTEQPAHKIATGFLSVGPKMLACDDPVKMRMDIVDEQVDTVGRAFLGMTFGCARCHDHKFDPISIEDYYGLAGIFRSTKTMINYKVVAKWHEYDLTPADVSKVHKEIESLQNRADNKENKNLTEDQRKALRVRAKALEKSVPPRTRVMGVTENEVEDVQVHLRGNYLTLGDTAPRRIPVVFKSDAVSEHLPDTESGRLQLAHWLVSRDNPLTARVLVNRLWRWHFGQGLVRSTDNFGKLGSLPDNQELLDYLAVDFMHHGWSVKWLQRQLMSSATYRMAVTSGASETIDPDNHFMARQNRRRMEAEVLHDSLRHLSGLLDLQMHGQLLKDQPGKYINRGHIDDYFKTPRRAVYLPIMRSGLYDAFVAFDMADPSMSNGDRRESVVAPQSLYLMNGELVHEASQAIIKRAPRPEQERLAWLYLQILNRPMRPEERARDLAFVDSYPNDQGWQALARVIFASNEFLYID